MKKNQKNRFWNYLEKWRPVFTEKKVLDWRDGWLDNDYCADCLYCCGPQGTDEPFPMALLPGQISGRTPDDFYLLNKNTACLGKEGCKSETSKGCRLPRELRPVACGLFPIVLANGRLYLYKTCPAVVFNTLDELAMLAEKAAGWLANFPLDELRHISLNLSSEKLAADYIDLGIEVFPVSAKKQI
ncbi:MAG: hypothetical protein OSJ28_04525 [Desulfovibrio sp.]|nr:hypothetical protein [Desulfovibrio sp.]